jgi:hypothetical protein
MWVFQKCNARLIIQNIYSQRGVRLKTVEIYCDFCCEDLVFSKVCFHNFLFSNLIKEFWNNFVYISHFTYRYMYLKTYTKFTFWIKFEERIFLEFFLYYCILSTGAFSSRHVKILYDKKTNFWMLFKCDLLYQYVPQNIHGHFHQYFENGYY